MPVRLSCKIPLIIVLLTALSPALAQKETAPPQPHTQAQLEDRVKGLETRLDATEQKAANAAMEKDYITRVQKQYETYYEKAFNTMITIFSLISVIIAVIAIVTGKLSLDFFDRRAQTAIAEASDKLRKEIASQNKDLSDRSNYLFLLSQGLVMGTAQRFAEANDSFRRALKLYQVSKPRHLIPGDSGVLTLRNLFVGLSKEYPNTFQEKAKEELADALYDDLHNELHDESVVAESPWLAPLIKERKPTLPLS